MPIFLDNIESSSYSNLRSSLRLSNVFTSALSPLCAVLRLKLKFNRLFFLSVFMKHRSTSLLLREDTSIVALRSPDLLSITAPSYLASNITLSGLTPVTIKSTSSLVVASAFTEKQYQFAFLSITYTLFTLLFPNSMTHIVMICNEYIIF